MAKDSDKLLTRENWATRIYVLPKIELVEFVVLLLLLLLLLDAVSWISEKIKESNKMENWEREDSEVILITFGWTTLYDEGVWNPGVGIDDWQYYCPPRFQCVCRTLLRFSIFFIISRQQNDPAVVFHYLTARLALLREIKKYDILFFLQKVKKDFYSSFFSSLKL